MGKDRCRKNEVLVIKPEGVTSKNQVRTVPTFIFPGPLELLQGPSVADPAGFSPRFCQRRLTGVSFDERFDESGTLSNTQI